MPGHDSAKYFTRRGRQEMRKLLIDLEANTTYHSFPRPEFDQEPKQIERPAPTLAETTLKGVLRTYNTYPVEDGFESEDEILPSSNGSSHLLAIYDSKRSVSASGLASKRETQFLRPPVPVSAVSKYKRLLYTDIAKDTLTWERSRPNSPLPMPVSVRPSSALSVHPPPQRVYSSPLDTLASTRLHIIEQEEEFRPYEVWYKQRLQRAMEIVVGVVVMVGVMVGGGVMMIGIGEGDLGGFRRLMQWFTADNVAFEEN